MSVGSEDGGQHPRADEKPLAVGAGGIKPQRAVDRATDPHNRQLLDPQTNRTTKHVRESEADIARHKEKFDAAREMLILERRRAERARDDPPPAVEPAAP